MSTLFKHTKSFDTASTTSINNENLSAKLINSSRSSSGTPKRHLSFQNMNSPPVSQVSKLPTPGIISSSTDLSPFIKRKCINKEKPIKFTTFNYNKSISCVSDSPYMLASDNLNSERLKGDESPKNLNDSFEGINNLNSEKFSTNNRYTVSRRRFSKHKSAPLSNLTQQLNNISSPISKLQYGQSINQPLNDISNQINQKCLTNSLANSIGGFKLGDDISNEERDDVTELENLIFGNNNHSTQMQIDNQNYIKQSLEKDSQCTNLIGDKSKVHILPSIASTKHPDLCCISPGTLVNVLDGVYDDKIKEVIIIDSRYPYEYEGGHITKALNIYTKERLYDEMFIKRSHKNIILNNSTMDMDSSGDDSDVDSKRSIIIFHCEFSSERGPSLLKFLRNSDRTLNEHCYPSLFYPELYLLEGGYKLFYENYLDYCEPKTYKPMLHEEHQYDYKHFRAKAKSWEVSRHHIVYKYNEHLQRQKSLKEEHDE